MTLVGSHEVARRPPQFPDYRSAVGRRRHAVFLRARAPFGLVFSLSTKHTVYYLRPRDFIRDAGFSFNGTASIIPNFRRPVRRALPCHFLGRFCAVECLTPMVGFEW